MVGKSPDMNSVSFILTVLLFQVGEYLHSPPLPLHLHFLQFFPAFFSIHSGSNPIYIFIILLINNNHNLQIYLAPQVNSTDSATPPSGKDILLDLPKQITLKLLASVALPDISYVQNIRKDVNTVALKVFSEQETALFDELEKYHNAAVTSINAGTRSPIDKRLETVNMSLPLFKIKSDISAIFSTIMPDIWKLSDIVIVPYVNGIVSADVDMVRGLNALEHEFTNAVRDVLNLYDQVEQEFAREIDEILRHVM